MAEIDKGGRSPLHYAAAADDAHTVATLLNSGAEPDAADRLGFTPLHFAALRGAVAAAAMLLAAGADVDAVNYYGNTPLQVAVFNSRGRGELIELLRRHGADPWHINNAGHSPVSLARLIGNYDVAQFFADLSDLT